MACSFRSNQLHRSPYILITLHTHFSFEFPFLFHQRSSVFNTTDFVLLIFSSNDSQIVYYNLLQERSLHVSTRRRDKLHSVTFLSFSCIFWGEGRRGSFLCLGDLESSTVLCYPEFNSANLVGINP